MLSVAATRDPSYFNDLQRFAKQRNVNPSSAAALANLSPRDRAELDRITSQFARRHGIGGFLNVFVVSALAFGLAGLAAGYLSHVWYHAWFLFVVSFLLNNPFRRFAVIADMPDVQRFPIALVAQLGCSLGMAYLGARLALARTRPRPTPSARETA